MLERRHRISRTLFPGWNTPKTQWNGTVLRCVLFPPFSPVDQARVAVVVSKKFGKNAVDRHLFSRRVFAVLTTPLLLHLFPKKRMIFFPIIPVHKITFLKIAQDIEVLLREQPWEKSS